MIGWRLPLICAFGRRERRSMANPRIAVCTFLAAAALAVTPAVAQTVSTLQPSPLGSGVAPSISTPNYKDYFSTEEKKQHGHYDSSNLAAAPSGGSTGSRGNISPCQPARHSPRCAG